MAKSTTRKPKAKAAASSKASAKSVVAQAKRDGVKRSLRA